MVVLLLGFALLACSSQQSLKVFMPGEYIDMALVDQFEDLHDVKVDIITFDSNESAIPQVQANAYDVVVPSDYAIEELVAKDLLLEIDESKITAMDLETDLAEGLKGILDLLRDADNGFDLLSYGVPYFWGNVGILYDRTSEGIDDLLADEGWNALRSDEHDVMFYDSSRDSFMVALKDAGASMTDPTETEIEAAETWLMDALGPRTVFQTDEVLDDMLDPARHDMAVVYSGDAVYLMDENENLGFYVPDSGTNVWIDAFVIPKNAPDVDLAYTFIDFMIGYEQMLDNTIEIGYTAPRTDVIDAVL
ncbi:MAG: ABC transporter substrate-binding protein, partial [Acholeplasmataceae bacterium]